MQLAPNDHELTRRDNTRMRQIPIVWTRKSGCDADAKAGYKLAQFVLLQESPAHESYWAAKLLRELYDAHAESTLGAVASVA